MPQTKKLTHEIELLFNGFSIILEAESVAVPEVGEEVTYGEHSGRVRDRKFTYSANSGLDPVVCCVTLNIE